MTVGTLLFVFLFIAGVLVSIFYLEYATAAIMGLLIVIPVAMILFLIRKERRVR